jgi:hypothetical protein
MVLEDGEHTTKRVLSPRWKERPPASFMKENPFTYLLYHICLVGDVRDTLKTIRPLAHVFVLKRIIIVELHL